MSVTSNSIANSQLQSNANKKSPMKGAFKMLGLGLTGVFGVMSYNDKREQGWGVAASAGYAAGEAALWAAMPVVMMAGTMASALPEMTQTALDVAKANRANINRMYNGNFGGNYVDTQLAGTMRQAGMYNIQQAKGSVQSRLGSEAKSYYRRNV
jgi:hypothetical protein